MKKIINKYSQFLKYFFSSGICFFIDIVLFTIFNILYKSINISNNIIIATISARIISSLINYFINKDKVFNKNSNKEKGTMYKYYLLVLIQLCMSSLLVTNIYNSTKLNETLIKIPVDCIIFVVNYFVQKYLIFKTSKINIDTNNKIYKFIISIISMCTILYKPLSNGYYNFSENLISQLVLTYLFYLLYSKFSNINKRKIFNYLSILFSIFMSFGYSFFNYNSGILIYGNIEYISVMIIKLIGYYYIISTFLSIIYDYLDNFNINELSLKNKLFIYFNNHPFKFSFIVLAIVYSIYIIAFYPGVVGYDPSDQIKEFMGISTYYIESLVTNSKYTITAFNPILHTLLLGSLFKFGHLYVNDNFGIFLYTIIQMICYIAVFSYTIKFMSDEGINKKILLFVLGMYIFVPIFPFYSLCSWKDTYFSLFFVLYIIQLYKILKNRVNLKNVVLLILVSFGLCMFRNNGLQIILMSLPFLLIVCKNYRKQLLIAIVSIILLYGTYVETIHILNIPGTSIREVLSVPFQQIASLVVNKEEVIDEEDKIVIGNILDYDNLKELYNPELSDSVKNTFNKNATNEDLIAFFKVWFKYLFKEPLIYVEATTNNIYGYFYPESQKWYLYYKKYNVLNEAGFDYHYNKLGFLRTILYTYGNTFENIPILRVFVNIGLVIWTYLYLLCYLIEKNKKKFIMLLLPSFSILFAIVIGPANLYYRYVFPMSCVLPLIICLLYNETKNKIKHF